MERVSARGFFLWIFSDVSQRIKDQKDLIDQLEDDNRELNKKILKLEKPLSASATKLFSEKNATSDRCVEELRIQIKHEVSLNTLGLTSRTSPRVMSFSQPFEPTVAVFAIAGICEKSS